MRTARFAVLEDSQPRAQGIPFITFHSSSSLLVDMVSEAKSEVIHTLLLKLDSAPTTPGHFSRDFLIGFVSAL